jgi:hypothetical protein
MIREDVADMVGDDMSGAASILKRRNRDVFLLFRLQTNGYNNVFEQLRVDRR